MRNLERLLKSLSLIEIERVILSLEKMGLQTQPRPLPPSETQPENFYSIQKMQNANDKTRDSLALRQLFSCKSVSREEVTHL